MDTDAGCDAGSKALSSSGGPVRLRDFGSTCREALEDIV